MKIRWSTVLSLLIVLAVASNVFAHGNKKHVMGTLEKISPQSVTVKTADGKLVEIKLAAETTYVTNGGKTAAAGDLVVGQRVVVHATPKGAELIADQVKFAAAGAAAAPGHGN